MLLALRAAKDGREAESIRHAINELIAPPQTYSISYSREPCYSNLRYHCPREVVLKRRVDVAVSAAAESSLIKKAMLADDLAIEALVAAYDDRTISARKLEDAILEFYVAARRRDRP